MAETVARNALLFGFTVIIARLLTPAQFGLVAMLGLFVGVASTLAEGGLGSALVQDRDPTDTDISTIFWTQMVLAVGIGTMLATLGPFLASWYDEPILQPLALAYAANVVLSAPASLPGSLMIKALDFRTPAIVAIAAQLAGGLSSVTAALAGMGAWSIVIQALVGSTVTTAALWICSSWRPSLQFSLASLRRYISVGIYTVGMGLLGEIENRVGSLVIGRSAGAADAGLYQRAAGLQLLLGRLLSGVISRVMFPAFASMRDDPDRLVKALRQATVLNFLITATVMWTLAVGSEPFIVLAFGAQWGPSAVAFEALCIAAGFYPIFAIFTKAQRALGKSRAVFFNHLVRALGVASVVVLLSSHGLAGIAWAQSCFLVLMIAFSCHSMARHSRYSLRLQAADFGPILISGVALISAGLFVRWATAGYAEIWRLLIISATAISAFTICLFLMSLWLRLPAVHMIVGTLKSRTK